LIQVFQILLIKKYLLGLSIKDFFPKMITERKKTDLKSGLSFKSGSMEQFHSDLSVRTFESSFIQGKGLSFFILASD